ncbi:MAG: hypothetical protein HY321_21885 [Armatimonadetes bacterium]|nr:hypothetical protein [Armatimonadota bacterium]
MLEVEVGFDGSCPQSPEGVRREGEGTFRVFPSWRTEPGLSEECLGRTTRLGFRVRNTSSVNASAVLHVDWQFNDAPPDAPRTFPSCEAYMALRDFCAVQYPGSPRWRYEMAAVEGSVATLRLTLPPGTTEVHWHPPYNYTQGEAFMTGLREREWTTVARLGTSREGRNLWLIRITDDTPRAKTPFCIRARAHGYESGGSYTMEGMVGWLLSDDARAAQARRDYEFFIVPMANPDGVRNGMGKLTAPRGGNLDLSDPGVDEPGHTALMALLARIRPAYLVDCHNWQSKVSDGILGMPTSHRERFLYYMPDISRHRKRWWTRDELPLEEPAPPREFLPHYCRRMYGSRRASFEISWFGRSPDDVRWFGANVLASVLMALAEPADLNQM